MVRRLFQIEKVSQSRKLNGTLMPTKGEGAPEVGWGREVIHRLRGSSYTP